MSADEYIEIEGARVHNLKNIDVKIPRDKLVVITGLSGSGKSSLAFDTIYAEGQRRYIETFSSYARQFLGNMERPDVDKITGLSPVISIEQKTVSRNPRSTVGTITEIYDFMRLLFARASIAYSKVTGEEMVRYSDKQIINLILDDYEGKKVMILAPVVKGRKGHYRELFEQIRRKGFLRARVDGDLVDLAEHIKLDRYKVHDVEIVVDRIQVSKSDKQRVAESVNVALKHGKGVMMMLDAETEEVRHFSRYLMCPTSGISYDEPAPNLFSFNSPYGACPKCNGLGEIAEADIKKIVPDGKKSIKQGAIAPLGEFKTSWIYKQIESILEKYGHSLSTPADEIEDEVMTKLLFGTEENLIMATSTGTTERFVNFEGVVNFILRHYEENPSAPVRRWAQSFMNKVPCPKCEGARLKEDALHFKVDGKHIFDLVQLDILHLSKWFDGIEERLTEKQRIIAAEVLKEIRNRISFLLDVGLDYLTVDRTARTLSGGEAQRIRLATQIGSELVGVLYILDEPSIGLHQRDNNRLINSLKKLRDLGNSVIVVEHDKDMIMASDEVLDVGPLAGVNGGHIVAQAKAEQLNGDSLTGKYLTGKLQIEVPKKRRKGTGQSLVLKGATGHNLKNLTVSLPLGKFICITGVSGSGKSSLINGTLYPILNKHFFRGVKVPLPYESIDGLKHLDKVIEIDQSPIGRTPRSNPATYTGAFTPIRDLFTQLPEAKIRGYKPGRFSFNVKGGRCETCKGAGVQTIEMNFLPDVYVECETCQGKRYNRETLEVRYKGKSISDVLNMTIDQACSFFEKIPAINQKISTLKTVGLGYVALGQPSTTLSGGEAQRIKLAAELSKKDTGQTFYILDEPTTGLHFEDIRVLLEVLNTLVDRGNTVLVIEHNMDMIKVADHLIDLGPEGGERGGNLVCQGTPEAIVTEKSSYTAKYLKEELG